MGASANQSQMNSSLGGGKGGGTPVRAAGGARQLQTTTGGANQASAATAAQQPASAPNVFQQSAQGITGAMGATAANMYNPLQGANIAAYQNPYTSQVIGQTAMDLARQNAMQQNVIGAEAQRAGAFGGSREAIQRAATNEAFMRNLGQTAANLRQQGFTQAQTAAQQDIQNRLQAAGQLANISNVGFGMGQTVQQNLAQQGAMQQALQQQLMDAAAAQYSGFQGAPAQGLGYLASALSSSPIPQSQKTSSDPGMLGYLTAGATIL